MEYFVIEDDNRLENMIKINMDSKQLKSPEPEVVYTEVYTELSDNTDCVDYIIKRIYSEKFYIFSDDLYSLASLYCPTIDSKPLFLTDAGKLEQKVYWRVQPENIDCLVASKLVNTDNLVLDNDKINGQHIFTVTHIKTSYMIVDLCLAENILRKYPRGLIFKPVSLEGGHAID